MRNLKKLLCSVLALCMVLALLPVSVFAASFNDTQNHWGKDAIDRWANYGVLNGVGGGNFDPNGKMTRGAFAQMLCNIMGYTEKAPNTFSDLSNTAWNADAILKLVAAGVITGYGNGTVNPNGEITRQEAAVMLCRAFGIQPSASASITFSDAGEVGSWAKDAVAALTERGMINGVGGNLFAPGSDINRASVAQMVSNMVSEYVVDDGATVTGNIDGIVIIKADNVKIEDATLNEPIIVAPAAADSTTTLSGVTVADEVYVEAEGAKVVVESTASAKSVEIEAPKAGAQIDGTVDKVVVDEKAKEAEVSVSGTVKDVTVAAPDTTVDVSGEVDNIEVESTADDTEIKTEDGAKVGSVTAAADTTVTGAEGTVGTVTATGSADVKNEGTGAEVKNEGTGTVTDNGKDVPPASGSGDDNKDDDNKDDDNKGGGSGTTKPANPTKDPTITGTEKDEDGNIAVYVTVGGKKTVTVTTTATVTAKVAETGKANIEAVSVKKGTESSTFDIIGKNVGTATITVSAPENGSYKKLAETTIKVYVSEAPAVTRAELAQMIYDVRTDLGLPETAEGADPFTDVGDDHENKTAIEYLASLEILTGYGNGMFGPDDTSTRVSVAVLIARLAGIPDTDGDNLPFEDEDFPIWAEDAVKGLCAMGVLTDDDAPDGKFDPTGDATKVVAEKWLEKYIELLPAKYTVAGISYGEDVKDEDGKVIDTNTYPATADEQGVYHIHLPVGHAYPAAEAIVAAVKVEIGYTPNVNYVAGVVTGGANGEYTVTFTGLDPITLIVHADVTDGPGGEGDDYTLTITYLSHTAEWVAAQTAYVITLNAGEELPTSINDIHVSVVGAYSAAVTGEGEGEGEYNIMVVMDESYEDVKFVTLFIKTVGGDDRPADKTTLNNLITLAERDYPDNEDGVYTSDSWNAFQTALAAAKTVAGKADATQTEINTAAENLSNAMNNLKEVPIAITGISVDGFPAKYDDGDGVWTVAIPEDNGLPTDDEGEDDLKDRIDVTTNRTVAPSMINISVTTADTDEATYKIEILETDTEATLTVTLTDELLTENLEAALEAAEAYGTDNTDGKYTAKSWAALTKAVADGEALLEKVEEGTEEVTQDEVNAAAAAITGAIDGLVDISGLKALVESIDDEYVKDKYTEESWAALEKAVEDANALLTRAAKESEDVSEDDVLAAIGAINAAISDLEKKDDDGGKDNDTITTTVSAAPLHTSAGTTKYELSNNTLTVTGLKSHKQNGTENEGYWVGVSFVPKKEGAVVEASKLWVKFAFGNDSMEPGWDASSNIVEKADGVNKGFAFYFDATKSLTKAQDNENKYTGTLKISVKWDDGEAEVFTINFDVTIDKNNEPSTPDEKTLELEVTTAPLNDKNKADALVGEYKISAENGKVTGTSKDDGKNYDVELTLTAKNIKKHTPNPEKANNQLQAGYWVGIGIKTPEALKDYSAKYQQSRDKSKWTDETETPDGEYNGYSTFYFDVYKDNTKLEAGWLKVTYTKTITGSDVEGGDKTDTVVVLYKINFTVDVIPDGFELSAPTAAKLEDHPEKESQSSGVPKIAIDEEAVTVEAKGYTVTLSGKVPEHRNESGTWAYWAGVAFPATAGEGWTLAKYKIDENDEVDLTKQVDEPEEDDDDTLNIYFGGSKKEYKVTLTYANGDKDEVTVTYTVKYEVEQIKSSATKDELKSATTFVAIENAGVTEVKATAVEVTTDKSGAVYNVTVEVKGEGKATKDLTGKVNETSGMFKGMTAADWFGVKFTIPNEGEGLTAGNAKWTITEAKLSIANDADEESEDNTRDLYESTGEDGIRTETKTFDMYFNIGNGETQKLTLTYEVKGEGEEKVTVTVVYIIKLTDTSEKD